MNPAPPVTRIFTSGDSNRHLASVTATGLEVEVIKAARVPVPASFVRDVMARATAIPEVAARLPEGASTIAVRLTGDRELVAAVWPMVEQAVQVCCGEPSGHPGLRMLKELNLISSAGIGDQLFGAFLYSNACVVAGLRAAARVISERAGDAHLGAVPVLAVDVGPRTGQRLDLRGVSVGLLEHPPV